MFRRIVSLMVLFAVPILALDASAAWGPRGCVAVAAPAVPVDGWHKSVNWPGWQVKYQNGQQVEWYETASRRYMEWRGGRWEWRSPATPVPDNPEVNTDAVHRMGDYARHIDGLQSEPDLFAEAVGGPPPSDADKWHISVITMTACPACTKLKRDWQVNANLRAFAKPDEPKASWAHFGYFDKADASQSWRWKDIRVDSYPTIIMQPPRTGKYGDPRTVVFQQTYSGNPDQLASAMSRALKRYLAIQPRRESEPDLEAGVDGHSQRPKTNPPFTPPPKVDPMPNQQIPWPTPGLEIPPAEQSPIPGVPVDVLVAGGVLAALAGLRYSMTLKAKAS